MKKTFIFVKEEDYRKFETLLLDDLKERVYFYENFDFKNLELEIKEEQEEENQTAGIFLGNFEAFQEEGIKNFIKELSKKVTVSFTVVLNNENIKKENLDLEVSYCISEKDKINNILNTIKNIAEERSFINLSFDDVKETLKGSGLAVLGYGDGEGENRALKAAEKVLSSPLLENSIQGANKILINLLISPDVGLAEAQNAVEVIRDATGKNIEDVVFGIGIVPEFTDRIEITIIAK